MGEDFIPPIRVEIGEKMTNRELSLEIRQKLKAAGFTNKDYSIRVREAGYDTSVRIYIKNPMVQVSNIEAIVSCYKTIDRDERTGEILSGGNTFVFCKYEDGIFDEVIMPLIEKSKNVFFSSKWDEKKIAENEVSEIYMTKINSVEKVLYMYNKKENQREGRCRLRSAEDLALAMWRYKNLGTIEV